MPATAASIGTTASSVYIDNQREEAIEKIKVSSKRNPSNGLSTKDITTTKKDEKIYTRDNELQVRRNVLEVFYMYIINERLKLNELTIFWWTGCYNATGYCEIGSKRRYT